MKAQARKRHGKGTGLIAAGPFSQSYFLGMPSWLAALGPVKSSPFRAARRLANRLHSGHAIQDYSDLEGCRILWIAVPETVLDRITAELVARTKLEGAMIVLCESDRDSSRPGSLLNAGARIASLNAITGSGDRVFVAEGDTKVLGELRALMAIEKRKLIELKPGSKRLFFAGLHLGSDLLIPWIAGAMESFRAAGFARKDAFQLVQTLGTKTLRAYGNSGSKTWNPLLERRARSITKAELEMIRAADPRLADLYARGIDDALEFFGRA